MSYYQRHVFFCLNEREEGTACCACHRAADAMKAAHLNARTQRREGAKLEVERWTLNVSPSHFPAFPLSHLLA